MGAFTGAAVAALVLLSIVAVSEARLERGFTSWTPQSVNYSADGREVDLIMKSQQERE